MRNTIADRPNNVVRFPQRKSTARCLTKRDRQEVADIRTKANAAGYDALMIHVVQTSENAGTTDYVAAYRADQPWSSWCFARSNGVVCSWNALTTHDAGTFSSMSDALCSILLGVALPRHAEATPRL